MFDPTVQSGTVNEHGSSVRRLRARRPFRWARRGCAAQRGPLSAVGRDLASGVPGACCGWPVSAAGTVPRIISLSW